MDVQELRKLTYAATGKDTADLGPEAADDAMRVASAIEVATIDRIQAGARVHALVSGWRDRHQFKKGDNISVSQLVTLVAGIMELVGWYEPPTIRVVNDPQPSEDPRR